jgi:3-deoxy-manno-octulosonate cytidylyltransferase (CMP-KDO synthetase)
MPDARQKMTTAIIIPARYASKRYPGKPLAPIAGRSMIERVWRIAGAVRRVDAVAVATDDSRIFEAVRGFGGTALMTPESCGNGTERAHAAAGLMTPAPDIIINLQGDAVLTPPSIVQALVDVMQADPGIPIATPAVRLSAGKLAALEQSKAAGDAGGTTVTFDRDGNALYFSKRIIPFQRKPAAEPPVFRHIGLYAYRREALERYLELPEGVFERAEEIEALRALENGIKMRVVQVDYGMRTHWSVDSPEDVRVAERIIAEEG